MTNPIADSPRFQFKGANNRPLITAVKLREQPKHGFDLWLNERATSQNKAPDLRGHLITTNSSGREQRIQCSGWVRRDANNGTRIILQTDLRAGGKLLGSIRAVTSANGSALDGSAGLRLSGKLTLSTDNGDESLVFTGELNRWFLDHSMVRDSALELGFPQEMVELFQRVHGHSTQQPINAGATESTPT